MRGLIITGEFRNTKILGGIGVILMLVGGFVPLGVLSIVGLILVILAVKQISDTFNDRLIFKNFLFFVILSIIGGILGGVIFLRVVVEPYYSIFTNEDLANLSSISVNLAPTLAIYLTGLIIFWILNLIGSLYLRKSFNSIAQHTKVDLFKTTGFVYFIGAILLIIVIGVFVILIAYIIMIIAFFKLPEEFPQNAEINSVGSV